MESLTIEGNRYEARFQNVKREADELPAGTDGDEGSINIWADYKMWWVGDVVVVDKDSQRETRFHFTTFARRNVLGGIRDESFEESLLLVRGKNLEGRFVSHRGGGDIVTDRQGVIDYLFEGLYNKSSELARDEFVQTIEIPLLEQHVLAERGYACSESSLALAG